MLSQRQLRLVQTKIGRSSLSWSCKLTQVCQTGKLACSEMNILAARRAEHCEYADAWWVTRSKTYALQRSPLGKPRLSTNLSFRTRETSLESSEWAELDGHHLD